MREFSEQRDFAQRRYWYAFVLVLESDHLQGEPFVRPPISDLVYRPNDAGADALEPLEPAHARETGRRAPAAQLLPHGDTMGLDRAPDRLAVGLPHNLRGQLAQKKQEPGEVTVKEKNYQNITVEKKFTIADYDQREAVSKVRALCFQVAMTSFMHYKWGSPMPLLFQCVMLPMNLADEPLVKIHVFGAKAEGKLARPFAKPPNPLADALGVNPDADDGAVARKPSKKDD